MFFMPGEEKDLYVQGDKINFVPGKITEFFGDEYGMSAAYVIDGQLYLNLGGKVKKVDTCTKIVALSDFGNAVAYSNASNEIRLYNYQTEKCTAYSITCSVDEIEDLVIDPNGKAFAYHNGNTNIMYLCSDGKQTSLGTLGYMEEIEKVSANGDMVYILGDLYTSLYCWKPSGEQTQIWSVATEYADRCTYFFNTDNTQVLTQQDGQTYISVNGATPVLFYNEQIAPMMDDCQDFYGSLFDDNEGNVIRIERDAEKSCVLLSSEEVADCTARIDRTGKYVVYCNHWLQWRCIPVNAKPGAESKLIFGLDPYESAAKIYFAEDMSFAYFMMNDNLYYGDSNGKKVVAQMHDEALWIGMVHMTDKGKGIYYSTADALYYYDGNTSTLVDSNPYTLCEWDIPIVSKIYKKESGSFGDTDEFYLIREDHKLERIPGGYRFEW
jgi:hypothetical protein